MAIKGIRGYGMIAPSGVPTSLKRLFDTRAFSLTLALEAEFQDAMFFDENAEMSVADTIRKSRTHAITVNFQSIDWDTLQLMNDEAAGVSDNVVFPEIVTGFVPATPFTVTDADLVGLEIKDLQVTLSGDGALEPLALTVGTSAASATAIDFDSTAGTITFHTSHEGRAYKYVKTKSLDNVPSLGVEKNIRTLGELQLFGVIDGPRLKDGVLFHVPKLARNSGWTLAFSDQVSIELQYRGLVGPGKKDAIEYYQIPA